MRVKTRAGATNKGRQGAARAWMARLAVAGAALVALLVGASLVSPRRPAPPPENVGLERELDRQIGGIAASLPRAIDPRTTLYAVAREGTAVVYRYRIDRPPEAHTASADLYKPPPGFAAKVCADPDAFATMMAGATLRYEYVDQSGAPVGEYDVDAHGCARLRPSAR